jgi:hypothetical protein
MIEHFISLFQTGNRKKTVILLVIAILLICISIIIGTTDNLPMIAMFFTGLILLYFGILHPWGKASRFAILTAVFIVILILDFIWPFINEGIAMAVGLGCLAGIIAGIIGIFTRVKGWKRLTFTASLLSLVALGIISTNLGNPSSEFIAPMTEWILIIGSQIFVTILLFVVGLVNQREKWPTKTMLSVASVILILLCIWGFHKSSMEFGNTVNSEAFAILQFRIYASVEIIIAALSLYALK